MGSARDRPRRDEAVLPQVLAHDPLDVDIVRMRGGQTRKARPAARSVRRHDHAPGIAERLAQDAHGLAPPIRRRDDERGRAIHHVQGRVHRGHGLQQPRLGDGRDRRAGDERIAGLRPRPRDVRQLVRVIIAKPLERHRHGLPDPPACVCCAQAQERDDAFTINELTKCDQADHHHVASLVVRSHLSERPLPSQWLVDLFGRGPHELEVASWAGQVGVRLQECLPVGGGEELLLPVGPRAQRCTGLISSPGCWEG